MPGHVAAVQGRFHLQMNQYVQVEGDTAKAHSYALIVEELIR